MCGYKEFGQRSPWNVSYRSFLRGFEDCRGEPGELERARFRSMLGLGTYYRMWKSRYTSSALPTTYRRTSPSVLNTTTWESIKMTSPLVLTCSILLLACVPGTHRFWQVCLPEDYPIWSCRTRLRQSLPCSWHRMKCDIGHVLALCREHNTLSICDFIPLHHVQAFATNVQSWNVASSRMPSAPSPFGMGLHRHGSLNALVYRWGGEELGSIWRIFYSLLEC
jgi:hypothetical protein